MRNIQAEILGQQIAVGLSPLRDFYTAWNKDEIVLPEDLETGKAIEEIYASLQEELIKEYSLGEDYVFFPDPPQGILYFVSATNKKHLPPEVAAYPGNYWYDHTREVWREIN